MKKRFLSLLALSVLLCGCAGAQERAWEKGEKALAQERYADAAEAFSRAGDYNDAETLRAYSEALELYEAGSYSEAADAFESLGAFRDCEMMVRCSRAGALEAQMRVGFESGDSDSAVRAGLEAWSLYSALPFFRDCDTRAADCREQVYTHARGWMDNGRYSEAAGAFEALGDCGALAEYCRASELMQAGAYTEAAARFQAISEMPEAQEQAEAALSEAYRQASEALDRGDWESAVNGFSALGAYRDAQTQKEHATVQLVHTRLQAGAFDEALEKLSQLTDRSVFPAADEQTQGSLQMFLLGFAGSWMNAHAGVMNAFFSCSLLQAYLEPGGELDTRLRSEITDEGPVLNYGFVFLSGEVTELLDLGDGYLAALVNASASCVTPAGPEEQSETLQVLVDTSSGTPLVAAVR